jgi:hypothetical protein
VHEVLEICKDEAMTLLWLLGLAGAADFQFQATDHCVAWKAWKRILLVGSDEPIGRNCSIKTAIVSRGKQKVFVGEFPLHEFKSGSAGRDESVIELLGGKTDPLLRFESEPLADDVLKKVFQSGGTVKGDLKFSNKSHSVFFEVKVSEPGLIQGLCKTTFSALGLEPPSVLGGLGAKVQDELELGFQFQKTKISGSSAP